MANKKLTPSPPSSDAASEEAAKPETTRHFAFVLYPDDPKSEWVLQHLNRRPQLYKAVYILHDKDVWGQDDLDEYHEKNGGQDPNWQIGEPKKAHYHVMITWPSATSPSAVCKRLGLTWVEKVTDKYSYALYMLHDGVQWYDKFQYPDSALQGDQKTISKLLTQNVHFVQLAQYANMARMGMSLPDMVEHVLESPDSKIMIETFDKYNHFIVAMRNDLKTTPRPSSVLSRGAGVEQTLSYCKNYGDHTNFSEV